MSFLTSHDPSFLFYPEKLEDEKYCSADPHPHSGTFDCRKTFMENTAQPDMILAMHDHCRQHENHMENIV